MRNYSKHCLVKKTYIHYRSYRGTFEILKQGGKCMYKSAETNCVNFKFSGNLLVKAYNYICTSTIFGSNVYMYDCICKHPYNIVMTNILDILRLINTHLEVKRNYRFSFYRLRLKLTKSRSITSSCLMPFLKRCFFNHRAVVIL